MVVEDDIARTKQDIENLNQKLLDNKELQDNNLKLREGENSRALINWYNGRLNELSRAAADINEELRKLQKIIDEDERLQRLCKHTLRL